MICGLWLSTREERPHDGGAEVEADRGRVPRHRDGTWVLTTVTGLGGELALATVPARVPLADVYAGITFPDKPIR